MKIGLCLVVAALGMVPTVPATAEPPEDSIRGSVTEVSRSAEVVVIEEDPSDELGSAKGEFAVTEETGILERQGGDLAPVPFEDLRVGQMVEATYSRARHRVVVDAGGRRQDRHPGWEPRYSSRPF